MEEFKEKILMNLKGEALDEYREEYNEMLLEKITEGRNNLRRDKYLTVSIEADDIDAAVSVFNRMDAEIKSGIKKDHWKERHKSFIFDGTISDPL